MCLYFYVIIYVLLISVYTSYLWWHKLKLLQLKKILRLKWLRNRSRSARGRKNLQKQAD